MSTTEIVANPDCQTFLGLTPNRELPHVAGAAACEVRRLSAIAASLRDRVSALEAGDVPVVAELAQLQSEVSALDTNVAALDTNVSTVQTSVTALQTAVANGQRRPVDLTTSTPYNVGIQYQLLATTPPVDLWSVNQLPLNSRDATVTLANTAIPSLARTRVAPVSSPSSLYYYGVPNAANGSINTTGIQGASWLTAGLVVPLQALKTASATLMYVFLMAGSTVLDTKCIPVPTATPPAATTGVRFNSVLVDSLTDVHMEVWHDANAAVTVTSAFMRVYPDVGPQPS